MVHSNTLAIAATASALAALVLHRSWRCVLPIGHSAALDIEKLPAGDSVVMLKANGLTRYAFDARGLQNGVTVLIHGISYPGVDTWRELMTSLRASGRCVLAYDLAGRGWSHISGAPMSVDLYVSQLEELLDALGLCECQLDLVGWSLGAVIASHFALRHARRVRSLVMLAPAGFFAKPRETYIGLLLGRGVKASAVRAMFALKGPRTLKARYAHEVRAMRDGGALLGTLRKHVDGNPALQRAYLSTLIDCPEVFDNLTAVRALGASGLPILLIFSKVDNAIGPPPDAAVLRELMPHAKVEVLDGPEMDHALHLTHPTLVEPLIRAFGGGK